MAQDLPRHLGQHSGGMVICQDQLDSVVPLEPATMPGRVVVQWDKEDCADMGIIKVDLLGLGMMAVIEECLELIPDNLRRKSRPGAPAAGRSRGLRGAAKGRHRGHVPGGEPRADVGAAAHDAARAFTTSWCRWPSSAPGPIVGKMVHPYLNRRQGREAPDCLHPSLEPVLRRTLGVPLFQEQLLRMAMIAAGFTGGEAEELRRAMGFKRSEKRMADIEVKLRAGMTPQRHRAASRRTISSAPSPPSRSTDFPESHAASFALLAYASAYLKCHYLAAFTCAMLNNQPMGFYSPAILIKDAQRHGLRVLPVDAMHSDWNCTVPHEDRPLTTVREFCVMLSLTSRPALCPRPARRSRPGHPARPAERPFTSIDDLALRVPELRKDELNRLAEIGALNSAPASPSPRCPLAGAARHPSGRSAARAG